ncbi:MAG TPA: DUF4199 domain-containing protein [Chitinophagaceae bacterium]|nr:DUF4199 domain-containing protein [Chitinophagaceae bacterium]
MEKKVTSHITKGIVISLILIVFGLIANFAGFEYESWYRWIPTLILCIGIIWACINYANQMNNAVTFGNVFAHGFKTSAVVTVLTVIFALISIYLIFPESKEKAMEIARQEMDKNPQITEEQADQAMEIVDRFFIISVIGGMILMTLIAGAISSLLGAAFAKKTPPSPFNNPNP